MCGRRRWKTTTAPGCARTPFPSAEYRQECEEFKRKESLRASAAQREAERLQALAGDSERAAQGRASDLAQLKKDFDALRVRTLHLVARLFRCWSRVRQHLGACVRRAL